MRKFDKSLLLAAAILLAPFGAANAKDCFAFVDSGVTNGEDGGFGQWFHQVGERSQSIGFGAGCSFSRGFGFELAQVQLGEWHGEILGYERGLMEGTDRIESSALYATYSLAMPDSRWNAAVKLGFHHWGFDALLVDSERTQSFASSRSGTEESLGIGVGYAVNKQWSAGLDWNRYRIHTSSESRLGLRLEYHFN